MPVDGYCSGVASNSFEQTGAGRLYYTGVLHSPQTNCLNRWFMKLNDFYDE